MTLRLTRAWDLFGGAPDQSASNTGITNMVHWSCMEWKGDVGIYERWQVGGRLKGTGILGAAPPNTNSNFTYYDDYEGSTTQFKSVPSCPLLVCPCSSACGAFHERVIEPVPFYPYYYWVGCTILQSCSWVQLKNLATLALAWIMSVAWLDAVLIHP